MKITSVDVIKTPKTEYGHSSLVFCRINTDEGIYGYGEAGVQIGDFALGSYELLKILGQMIIGKNPLEQESIYSMMMSTFWAQGNGGVIMAAISAIDVALWDIKGKYFNVPCYMLLGGKQRPNLRCYASQLQGGWKDPNFLGAPGDLGYLKEACEKALDEGYDCVKVDFLGKKLDGTPGPRGINSEMRNWIPREYLNDYIARVECVRDTIGPDNEIIMENHNITNATTALQFARLAEPYDIMFLEEGCTPLNPGVMRKIAENTSIPLATGERTYTRWGFLPFMENHSLSLIQPDIGNCGGITEAKKICDLAHIFDVGAQMHVCSSPISVVIALHLEASIPNFIIHEHHIANTTSGTIAECIYDYQPVNGYFTVPDLPGIGQDISPEAIKKAEIIHF